MRGQDPSAWLHQTVLPPLLEPGEQIGPIGLCYVENFPLSMETAMFDGMREPMTGKPLKRGGEQQAWVVLTSHRMLVLPGTLTGSGPALYADVAGVVTIRYAAMRDVKTEKTVQKYWLSPFVKNPHRPNDAGVTYKMYYWSKETDVSSHADFVARAADFTRERVAAARGAMQPEPAMFFEAPAVAHRPPAYPAPMPGYPPPPYPYPMPFAGQARTSGMAITGFVLSFFCGLLGLIFSAIAMSQIKKSNGALKGGGLAIAGLVISIVAILINLAWLSMRRKHHF
jgi:hypothetical protein